MLNEESFKLKAKAWLNNKFILAEKSQSYKVAPRKDAVIHAKNLFADFLRFPAEKYSVAQLAVLLKRHEDLLLSIMPIPQNPSYEKAFNALSEILNYANNLINQKQLNHML